MGIFPGWSIIWPTDTYWTLAIWGNYGWSTESTLSNDKCNSNVHTTATAAYLSSDEPSTILCWILWPSHCWRYASHWPCCVGFGWAQVTHLSPPCGRSSWGRHCALCLPSTYVRTTHLLQPLDVGAYGPLKKCVVWGSEELQVGDHGRKVDKGVFPSHVAKMWACTTIALTIIFDFRARSHKTVFFVVNDLSNNM